MRSSAAGVLAIKTVEKNLTIKNSVKTPVNNLLYACEMCKIHRSSKSLAEIDVCLTKLKSENMMRNKIAKGISNDTPNQSSGHHSHSLFGSFEMPFFVFKETCKVLTEQEHNEIKHSIIEVPWHERLRLYADKKRDIENSGQVIHPQLHADLINAFEV